MHIGSGLNTVSSMYRQQKGNNMKVPVSAENTFYTAETPKVYQIFTTDNMLWTGGNGTGLSYCLKSQQCVNKLLTSFFDRYSHSKERVSDKTNQQEADKAIYVIFYFTSKKGLFTTWWLAI